MTIPWESLPPGVLETMVYLGNFRPTLSPEYREVKGYKLDADGDGNKAYLTAADLREMAGHMCVVADWLDERAGGPVGPTDPADLNPEPGNGPHVESVRNENGGHR